MNISNNCSLRRDGYTEKTDKEAYLYLQSKVCGNAWRGGWEQRCLLLAYAFLNKTPYVALERKINEDKFPNGGTLNFVLYNLAFCVASCLAEAYGIEKNDIQSSGLYNEVKSWMMEKYASEVAA